MTDKESEQCTVSVFDQTPGSEQKKINVVVRSHFTVKRVIDLIGTQFSYEKFELLLQPHDNKDLVNLNALESQLMYEVAGFEPQLKNHLILLPSGSWDGDVTKRFELPIKRVVVKKVMKSDGEKAKSPATGEKKKRVVGEKTKKKPASGSSSPSKAKTTSEDSLAKTSISSESSPEKTSKIKTTAAKISKPGSEKAPRASPEECPELSTEINSKNTSSESPVAKKTAKVTSKPTLELLSPIKPSSPIKELDCEPVDTLSKQQLSEQLQLYPQGRNLISPVDDAPSDLFISDAEQLSDDDLALGASASPTMLGPGYDYGAPTGDSDVEGVTGVTDPSTIGTDDGTYPALSNFYRRKYGGDELRAWQRVNTTGADFVSSATTETEAEARQASLGPRGYVGLVNQAMTCYLNSLLQALFMTPEFRNALYRWEFDNDNEAKNIPYQLQKLFLNLQTSPKAAVETTDLTRSFGWDSTEAWQQHDIQELCRVMFDALEHKFKNTKQANLISNLYEGKMNDYVKCLECNTEKTREDTFLDIPLPVRPFGSSSAYGSIEEALRAFVQPETLDGNNQYLCEKCKKKCDAHKGLHFKSFPYILTLHLKRFDFDYQTMHRIKLNDRVTFPQTLNLNTFINRSGNSGEQNSQLNGTVDDCSTADSGSAMEDDNLSSGVVTTASSSQHENDLNDEDEGIDMSSSTSKSAKQGSGPYLYELFAIMIHSGSASGGHYYAYIKDFDNNEWFCFNDQNVTSITQEDIQRSFGGPNGSYYSSAYTSSTNAYMLMYRQVDAKRNELVAKVADFPEHIKTLLPKLHSEEETRVSRLGRHITVTDLALPDLYKPRVYFYNPSLKKMKITRVYVSQSFNINLVLMSAYEMLNVEQFAPLSRCRLVAYNSSMDTIIQSLESCTDPALTELRAAQNYSLDFLLEYRAEDQEFEVYPPNGITWYVFKVDLSTMAMDGPFLVYSAAREREASDVLRRSIALRLHISEQQFLLATVRATVPKAFVSYDPHPTPEALQHLQNMANTQFKSITYFYLNVPNTDAATLEMLGVPTVESVECASGGDVVDAAMMNGVAPGHMSSSNDYDWRRYKRDLVEPMSQPSPSHGHESNSEDSSLSDGDRTLVETDNMAHRGGGDSQVSSTSHSPQLSSPEDEAASHDAMMRVHAYCNGNGSYAAADVVDPLLLPTSTNHFFYATKVECVDVVGTGSSSGHQSDEEAQLRKPTRAYKLLVGTHMRMGAFKKHIEQLIQVPAAHFKLQRKHDNNLSNNQNNSLVHLIEGETLTVELGKTLEPDEFKAKIHFLRLADIDNETSKLPCVCEWVYNANTTAEQAKKELVAKLHRIDAKYATLSVQNCRIWLKGGRIPIKILSDDETLYCDMRSSIAAEFIVQECEEEVDPQPKDDSLTLFVRRWCPAKLEFGKFQEITLDQDSEIRLSLSQISDIPIDKLSYMKLNSNFPCTSISALSVNESSSWYSVPTTLDKYPLNSTQTGNIYLYKDRTVPARELTLEERRLMNAREKARLDRVGCVSTTRYAQRRERALKIYLDSPEKSSNVTASAPMDVHVNN
uniref:Ubiquitin carboxyl-terminal hydrolase 47 n=1 Tax=Drosophila melanogaster TaxID=7227 RepID=UBPE_DROME|nr:ubiquitin specific protease 47, isoform B [Drosophila melanogaster]NP_729087.1 ubiquitin specific protease 47, isoform A [Drosophila melanogaster]Q24574.2 RecName: Full=Ubiquitin carboxyl-terminal hydrolase 47; AltName: Full=Ubiquitin thioesterase 47; AltName: Full=Ubiquitin-specific-processing protease 47 [Drosophila melanogaster]AAF50752.2 ubiquitin specific protease 47, isoform A [Drosophila melanogaster]AAN12105.1 ubiquitin specific protease 47, isoform B [Drosophila melanogaster]AAO414|eukprot:NP_523937.2 ubiquitin specific protease 47, isoform B [Drosophila melanogaster]